MCRVPWSVPAVLGQNEDKAILGIAPNRFPGEEALICLPPHTFTKVHAKHYLRGAQHY